jgi:D-3-phosphoglycerate dehydrogenase
MKVLITDPVADQAIKTMRDAGLTVDVKTDLSPEELLEAVKGYDVMVVRSATKVTDKVIDSMDSMKFIVRGGVGLDNIDRDAAKKKGIEVTNTPEASSISVAELTMGHMLSMCRHIPRGTAGLKGGKWEKKQLKGCEVFGKTLGLLGIGRIGREVATRALGLGMKVVSYDPYVKSIEGIDVKLVSLEELLSQSDFISLHLPKSDETAHMLGHEQFEKMKDGVRIINCARGGIIDEDALFDALRSGKVAGAAIDVFEKEPASDNKLFTLENVIGTPHIGASTSEGQGRVGSAVAEKIINWAKNR